MANKTVEKPARKTGDISGKYRIVQLIAYGGFARIYEVEDVETTRRWAMKEYLLTGEEKTDTAIWLNVKAEADALNRLRIREIPYIYDMYSTDDSYVIIMSLIKGTNLYTHLIKYGAFDAELLREVSVRVLNILDRLHSQDPPFIYRDIKPSNIMLVSSSGPGKNEIALIDFGTIMRDIEDEEEEAKLCTREYAAPEQLGKIKSKTDARSDIYCFGVTMYQLLTKKDPKVIREEIKNDIEREIISEDHDGKREGLLRIIEKCIQYDPDNRFQSAGELKHAIIHADEITSEYQEQAAKEKRLKLAGWLTAAMLLTAGIITGAGGVVDVIWKCLIIAGGIIALLVGGSLTYLYVKNGKKSRSTEFSELVKETDDFDDEDLDGTNLLIRKEDSAESDLETAVLDAPLERKTTGRFVIRSSDIKKAVTEKGE